jgi:hypothetical protein
MIYVEYRTEFLQEKISKMRGNDYVKKNERKEENEEEAQNGATTYRRRSRRETT